MGSICSALTLPFYIFIMCYIGVHHEWSTNTNKPLVYLQVYVGKYNYTIISSKRGENSIRFLGCIIKYY